MGKHNQSFEERLWSKTWIDESRTYNDTPCWRWSGAKNPAGYGVMNINPEVILVHRLSAHLNLGLNLRGSEVKVCHHCDTPDCWNPGHLFLGAPADNNKDMHDKGR